MSLFIYISFLLTSYFLHLLISVTILFVIISCYYFRVICSLQMSTIMHQAILTWLEVTSLPTTLQQIIQAYLLVTKEPRSYLLETYVSNVFLFSSLVPDSSSWAALSMNQLINYLIMLTFSD